jgi:hypothetical protein
MKLLLPVAVLVLMVTSQVVRAEEELEVEEDLDLEFDEEFDVDELELEDELLEEDEAGGPSRDIDTQVLFVDNPQKKFVIGKPISMLTSFVNRGDRSFNITRFGAHLHSPYDYSYFIQNFTSKRIGDMIEPTSEMTLEYTFKSSDLEPLDFWLSAWVEYDDLNGKVFRSTVYNDTVTLVDGPMEYTLEFGLNCIMWVGIAYACYQFSDLIWYGGKKKRKAPSTAVQGESEKAAKVEQPAIAIYQQAERAKSRSKKRR